MQHKYTQIEYRHTTVIYHQEEEKTSASSQQGFDRMLKAKNSFGGRTRTLRSCPSPQFQSMHLAL